MEEWKTFLKNFDKIKGRLNISPAHLYLTLKYARSRYGVSRYLLMKELNLSEASARTLLKKIKQINVLLSLRGGHVLTEKGEKILECISEKVEERGYDIPIENLAPCIHMVIVRKYNKTPDVVILRDSIIRYGGLCAMVLYKTKDSIIFPDSGEKLRKYYPELDSYLNDKVRLNIGDLVVMSGGNSYLDARLSVLNAIFDYLK